MEEVQFFNTDKKINLDLNLKPYIDYGTKGKTQNYKTFRKKIEENLQALRLSKSFLELMLNAQSVKEKTIINKLNFVKIMTPHP